MDYHTALIFLAVLFWVIFGVVKWRQVRRANRVQALVEQALAAGEKLAAHAEKEYGPLGRTTDEILSHDDKESNVLGTLCYRIGQKAATRGESSLTDTEKRLFAAYQLEGEVMNGGFDQYFFNSSGSNAELALAGLKDMGATAAAALLERAIAVFPGGKPPADRQSRWEAMDKIASRTKTVWEECDSEFYDRKEDTYELCLVYARKKRAGIILP